MKKKYLLTSLSFLFVVTLACSLFNPELFSQENTPDTSQQDSPAQENSSATANSTDTASENQTAEKQSACYNIFYPLVAGQQMVYKTVTPEGETKTELTVVSTKDNFATVDMLNLQTGILSQSIIECDNGAIKNSPAVSMNMLQGVFEGSLDVRYVDGYVAPSEETLAANDWQMSWETSYIMNGDLSVTYNNDTFSIFIEDSPVTTKWETAATGQSVIVAAGAYENAVEVTSETSMEIKLETNGMKIDSTLLIKSTHWFEPYVGQVKMETTEVLVSLQGMTFPVEVDETMELVEFHPAE